MASIVSTSTLRIVLPLLVAGVCTALVLINRQAPLTTVTHSQAETKSLLRDLGALPLAFEANQGQTDPEVRYLSRGPGYALFLTANEAVLSLRAPANDSAAQAGKSNREAVLRMAMDGANAAPVIEGVDELALKSNYLLGHDRGRWQNNIPNVAKVKYQDVYPGIDLVYYGHQRQLEYDFVVSPGADPRNIRMRFKGTQNQRVGQDGGLHLAMEGGELTFAKPVVYQQDGEARRPVAGDYMLLADGAVGFRLGDYDTSRTLVIDPMLALSSYFGGPFADKGAAITVSGDFVYITGETLSAGFPVTDAAYNNGVGIKNNGSDVFVMMLDAYLPSSAPGGQKLFATFLGGNGDDRGYAIAVDGAGSVYVTGETASNDFPVTTGALQAAKPSGSSGDLDIFLTKLSPTGVALQYSTYLGSTGRDSARAIALQADPADPAKTFVYLGGETESLSNGWPSGYTVLGSYGGRIDGFAAKIKSDLLGVDYFVYLGDAGDDGVAGIALDANNGKLYLAGKTDSSGFPQVNAYQSPSRGGLDAFFVKLNLTSGGIESIGILGGAGNDSAHDIALDSAGSVHIAGETASTDFPIMNAYQEYNAGGTDAFITKLAPGMAALNYSTYLGGSGDDQAMGIAVDAAGYAYVVGGTASQNFPLLNPFQGVYIGATEGFASQLNLSDRSLVFSSFFGGSGIDIASDVAIDVFGNMFIVGTTASTNFPLASPEQGLNIGGEEAFLLEIQNIPVFADLSISTQGIPDPVRVGGQLTYEVSVTNNGPDAASGITLVDTLPANVRYGRANSTNLNGPCTISGVEVTCNLNELQNGEVAKMTVTVDTKSSGTATNKIIIAHASQSDPDPANNTASTNTAVKGGSIGGGAVSPVLLLVMAGLWVYRTQRRRYAFNPIGFH